MKKLNENNSYTPKILLLAIFLSFSYISLGQNCFELDTTFTVEKSKEIVIETNKHIYQNPPTLTFDWKAFSFYCGKSVDCKDNTFDFLLVSFIDTEGHFANIIFKYISKKNIELLNCHFTIDKPEKVFKEIEGKNDYWNCDI